MYTLRDCFYMGIGAAMIRQTVDETLATDDYRHFPPTDAERAEMQRGYDEWIPSWTSSPRRRPLRWRSTPASATGRTSSG